MLTKQQISKWNKFIKRYQESDLIIKIKFTKINTDYHFLDIDIGAEIRANTKLGKQMYDKLEEMGIL